MAKLKNLKTLRTSYVSHDRDKVMTQAGGSARALQQIYVVFFGEYNWSTCSYDEWDHHLPHDLTTVRYILPRGEVTKLS